MDDHSALLQALNQHSFIKKLREQIIQLEEELQERKKTVLNDEAELSCHEQALVAFEQQLMKKTEEVQKLRKKVDADRKEQLSKTRKRLLLLDILDLYSGRLFQGNARGAKFFTQNLQTFAITHNIGELMIEDALKNSKDGLTISINQSLFWYVKGEDSEYYFHPEAIEDKFGM